MNRKWIYQILFLVSAGHKERRSMKLSDERKFVSEFYGEDICEPDAEELSKEDELMAYDEAISFYTDMLNSARDRNDHSDIALCKRELQEAKDGKRRLLTA